MNVIDDLEYIINVADMKSWLPDRAYPQIVGHTAFPASDDSGKRLRWKHLHHDMRVIWHNDECMKKKRMQILNTV